jgi:hypothetical protein
MTNFRVGWLGVGLFILVGTVKAETPNLIVNPGFEQRDASGQMPANYELTGDAEYRYLGDPTRDASSWGVAFKSQGRAGSVSQTVRGIDSKTGRWFRFSFRGLPQDDFAVDDNDLSMRVEFFGNGGHTSLDAKGKSIYPIIQQARRDLTANGDRHIGGAAVWRTYALDVWLPFPQVDTLRLSVNFGHGAALRPIASEFFVDDFSLTRLPPGEAPEQSSNTNATPEVRQTGTLLSLGGRWYYDARPGETEPPKSFDSTNADRLLYRDAALTAPFAGSMTAWLRAGDKDLDGNIVTQDQLITDNVTVRFDTTSMIIRTKGLPNHPTGKFPQPGFGPDSNPNFIQEHDRTYYIPLDPKVNPNHIATTMDNSNHALPMGPIGVAVNGVVFFNPFDAQSTDATSMMDRCCGHPSPDNTYHYHKYPICLNSPWSDEGNAHSPLIGWAFDGFPIYGPYESAGVMAKDVTGASALNDFNMQWDSTRGWHYHVTPGKFPYIIGGFWGYEDSRDKSHGRGPGNGRGGPGNGPPMGFPPPPPF